MNQDVSANKNEEVTTTTEKICNVVLWVVSVVVIISSLFVVGAGILANI